MESVEEGYIYIERETERPVVIDEQRESLRGIQKKDTKRESDGDRKKESEIDKDNVCVFTKSPFG